MPDSPTRTIAANVLIALVATLVPLCAIEMYYRVTYRAQWYAGHDFPPGHYPHLNADRLRDIDYGPKTLGTYRILLLGDSFTFGSGVEDDDAIWPAIIERRLGELRPLPLVASYEVLNGGLPGSLTDQWVALYGRQKERFRPDLVIVVFFLRDGTRFEYAMNEQAASDLGAIEADRLARISTAYRYFREKWWTFHFAGELSQFFVDSYVGSVAATGEWRRAQRNILSLRDMAAADGSKFALVSFPMLFALDDGVYPFQAAMDAIRDFADANGLAHLSLLPAFRGRRAPDLWVSSTNQHPNREGHAIAASALLPFVREVMQSP
jgi:hypothetical protein